MTEWAKAAAMRPDLAQLCERVLASMGSVRGQAFAELREAVAETSPGDRADYELELSGLATLELESTEFETRFRDLHRRMVQDLASHPD
jgi:hypothetical protein